MLQPAQPLPPLLFPPCTSAKRAQYDNQHEMKQKIACARARGLLIELYRAHSTHSLYDTDTNGLCSPSSYRPDCRGPNRPYRTKNHPAKSACNGWRGLCLPLVCCLNTDCKKPTLTELSGLTLAVLIPLYHSLVSPRSYRVLQYSCILKVL